MADANGPCAVCGRWLNRPVTVSAVVLRGGKVLLVKRGGEPGRGMWALPGGYMDMDETAAEACAREVREETGLDVRVRGFVGYYDDPNRSPTQTVGLAFLVEPIGGVLAAGDDADDVMWRPLDSLPHLAFDHGTIVAEALRRTGDV